MRGLTGKRIVICGGATGIGAATAVRLAEEGCRVLIGDVNVAGAEETAGRIIAAGGTALAAGFDLSDEASVRTLMDRAVSDLGGVNGLFNVGADLSPGTIGHDGDLSAMDAAVWRRTLEVNLIGYAHSCRAVIPLLLERGGGAIVNTSSNAAFVGEPLRPAYAASKAGVNALTRHVASRWGKKGIRCNGVSPGMVLSETGMTHMSEEFLAAGLVGTRSTRLGRPSDLAAVVAFLLSDDAEWINGQTWSIDGGGSLRD
ncbi:NAD(P)-dependent dehydrogenase (short-subunit alcohol dehydrogenase family) [Streptosporangium becharense]|uniref:NAD(P)-dependent dehydrogenase (Short-subunit alcohol dehydrogenase family) n=1 Tax=Streptosporangium becharense TaxID=1816182 RepID=A0A7W9MII4_9ACTN|nr:SDR family oxidoreductase [Streptosporangium becharense]MBB2911291.1 NAD(P)-dependent dehydrogenase (short-subunit alcohol dehydrogenase family) [Streptosporangium becharense]MBB5821651.1 NAD(P)-dependent dehydrogenase (short-subunit alcohol dehydrogenase family) [Streptosporangium becharense]